MTGTVTHEIQLKNAAELDVGEVTADVSLQYQSEAENREKPADDSHGEGKSPRKLMASALL